MIFPPFGRPCSQTGREARRHWLCCRLWFYKRYLRRVRRIIESSHKIQTAGCLVPLLEEMPGVEVCHWSRGGRHKSTCDVKMADGYCISRDGGKRDQGEVVLRKAIEAVGQRCFEVWY